MVTVPPISAPSATPVTVTASTLNSAGLNEGTATDNGDRDYVRRTELLTFAPGEKTQTFVVTVLNDRITERPRGQGSIVDDDGPAPGSGGGGGRFDASLLAMLGPCVLGIGRRRLTRTSAARIGRRRKT